MLAALENGVKGGKWFSLIDKVYRAETLKVAWQKVAANGGAAGVDGQSVKRFAARAEMYLKELSIALERGTYRPMPVRRVEIAKGGGKHRPLGIPVVKDRIVQTALKFVLEPIFEREFLGMSYGFRPGLGCKDALREVEGWLKEGYTSVVDADLRSYFDTIPHARLMERVKEHVSDGRVVELIEAFLQQDIIKDMQRWTPVGGTPQGAVISPLLSNLYLHWFDKVFHRVGGPAHWANAKLVRYADDFVVLARYQGEKLSGWIESKIEGWMGLEINRDKTRVIDLRQQGEELNFLGYMFRYDRDLMGKPQRYLNVTVSERALKRERQRLREMINSQVCFKPLPELIEELNRHLKGWANYFSYGYPRKGFRQINRYVRQRLKQHVRRRSQRPFRPVEGVSYYGHFKRMGLVYL